METLPVLFAVFSACTLVAALRVITASNPVHAVLYLVLAFFSSACLWMLLQAEFLAIALVLVYVGAVMVLFLFVVMMLDTHIDRGRAGFWRHLPVATLVGVAIALQLWLVLAGGQWSRVATRVAHTAVQAAATGVAASPASSAAAAPAAAIGNTRALGELTFTQYLLPLQLAGAILLVAMIAAIALTHRRRADSLRQSVPDQVAVRSKDRLRMVSMPSARPAPSGLAPPSAGPAAAAAPPAGGEGGPKP